MLDQFLRSSEPQAPATLIRRSVSLAGACWALLALSHPALAATLHLQPGQSFEAAVESLRPGDLLVVHAGEYLDSGRISITVKGTADQPVVIRAAEGEAKPHIRRAATSAVQNTINIEGATYLTIAGLEISGNGGDGINLNSNPAYITLEDLEIHDVDVGINFRSSMNDIVVRRNEIHRTGAPGSGTGEGMYVGCNYAECVVRNSLIENNWIHDTRQSTQGDGIEIKLGSYGNVIRDNVIHDTGYPCILTYGTNGNPVNVVEGNVMWNCGDSGIQTAADAVIRNNIIFGGSSNGFNSQSHQGAVPANLRFVHNTIVGGQPCVRLSGWTNRPGLVFANNAVYCDGGGFSVGDLTGVVVTGNVISPSTTAFPSAGFRIGGTAAADLASPAERNVYPTETSRVIDAGSGEQMTDRDFNGRERFGAPDAGAYERSSATNPGWRVSPGFKAAAGPSPEVSITANSTSIAAGSIVELTWSSAGATSCLASGNWSGEKPLAGSESVGPLGGSGSFVLRCVSSAGVETEVSVTVTVAGGSASPSLTLSATPNPTPQQGFVAVEWLSANATSCTAVEGPWTGVKALQGSEPVGPMSAPVTLAMTCVGPGGSTTRSVAISLVPVPVVQISASPTSVASGRPSTLTWAVDGASTCIASGAWAGPRPTSGWEQTAKLSVESIFELECIGGGGSARNAVQVTIASAIATPSRRDGSTSGAGSLDSLLALLLMSPIAMHRARLVATLLA